MDDTLSTPGLTLHLVRFEAHGSGPDAAQVQWDFGDGTRGAGRTATHVYFKPGEYRVTVIPALGTEHAVQPIMLPKPYKVEARDNTFTITLDRAAPKK